jgi:hypothetical protein
MGLFFAVGGVVGLFGMHVLRVSRSYLTSAGLYLATPIAGALLTSQYRWLQPTLFAGASISSFAIGVFLID